MNTQELIEKTGLTDAQLAIKLECNAHAPYMWRKGSPPHRMYRKALCKLAGVSMDDVTWERTAIRAALEGERNCPREV